MNVSLAIIHADPQERLHAQIKRIAPVLADIFDGIAVRASAITSQRSLERFAAAGAHIYQDPLDRADGWSKIGLARRDAIRLALQLDCPFILYCDSDRILHWAERYPQELTDVVARLSEFDFTVLGRTPRAFATHPRMQRDTEAIVNHIFATFSGRPWDVTAAARGLSRRAAEAILDGCFDEEVSTDVSWPVFLQGRDGFAQGYLETNGLEFETADRFEDKVTAAGGLAQWLAQLDADPRRWVQRLEMARVEVEAMLPYMTQTE